MEGLRYFDLGDNVYIFRKLRDQLWVRYSLPLNELPLNSKECWFQVDEPKEYKEVTHLVAKNTRVGEALW